MEYETKPQPETLKAAIEDLGLSIRAEFVPWSKSRNATKKVGKLASKSLNWRVTLYMPQTGAAARPGATRKILETDYSAGIAHCPSYKQGILTMLDASKIEFEVEHGKCAMGEHNLLPGLPIKPESHNVIHSLVLDSDVLDYSSFEEWGPELGYDADSRAAEKIYQACLKIALALRNVLGEDGLAKLREASQDY
jgi:hypothetical protein